MADRDGSGSSETETERVRRIYDRAAARFDKAEKWERRLFGADVRGIVRDARGDVLELAVGTGRNLPLYAGSVRLSGVELSGAMLELARIRAADLGLDADLRRGDVQSLPFDDASVDTVVCTFSLCTIPDDRRALEEAHRVLRPGGSLLLAEHVRSPNGLVRMLERVAEPIMLRIAGDHLLRDPLDHLETVGFAVDRVERTRLGVVERVWAHKP
jgi:ubiquinone/menaquinone biosynthesis C-methylase UbiE